MVASWASHLGWIAVVLLGQHGWASGESTCASVIVSDVRDLDGTYTLDSSISYPYYFRAGGTTTYKLYQYSGAWYILDDRTNTGYRTFDLSEHPADITLPWVECTTSTTNCDLDEGLLQPVITCAGDTVDPTPSPTARLTPWPTTDAVEEEVVDPAPVAGSDDSSLTPAQDGNPNDEDDEGDEGSAVDEGNDINASDSSGDDGYTKEIIIATVSTAASAAIVGVLSYVGKKFFCSNGSAQ